MPKLCISQCRTQSKQSTISPPKHIHHTIAVPEYSNTAKAQDKDIKTNFMKIIEGKTRYSMIKSNLNNTNLQGYS